MRTFVLVLLLSSATGIMAHPGHGALSLHAHAPDWMIMLVAICLAVAAVFAIWKR